MEAPWSEGDALEGYLAVPASGKPRAAVVVCPDSDGATAYFKGITRALAKAGHAALLADPFAREGGTDSVPASARAARLTAPDAAAQRAADVRGGALLVLREAGLPEERLGIVGFGLGAATAWAAAAASLEPRFHAAVLLSPPPGLLQGDPPDAPVLVQFGQLDHRNGPAIDPLMRRLRTGSSAHAVRVLAGARRNFWLTAPSAERAWRDTLAWLERHLVRRAAAGAAATPADRHDAAPSGAAPRLRRRAAQKPN